METRKTETQCDCSGGAHTVCRRGCKLRWSVCVCCEGTESGYEEEDCRGA